ncbi:MBL fold metallo-hydrolase [Candidatus Dependentiae bacterium]
MFKNLFNNKNYVKYDLTPIERIKEFIKTFWHSKSEWFLNKSSKRYYAGIDARKWLYVQPTIPKSHKPKITWIGQSTFLIQFGNVNILTDPVFSNINPIFPRNFVPGISLNKLPKIDYIIISHNHADHMDKNCLLYLKAQQPKILVPKGDKAWFDYHGFENTQEMDWWQNYNSKTNIKFRFLPAIHWSGYNIFRINKAMWGSWMLEFNNYKIYFAGDTAYAKHFCEISKEHPNIDIAMLPIGPENPRNLVKQSHMDSKEAVNAFIDLKAKHFIPMHWGTFRIDSDKFYDPIRNLEKNWDNKKDLLFQSDLNIFKFGQRKEF